MSQYKIDPEGVATVTGAIRTEAAEFEAIFKPLNPLVDTAVAAAFDLGPIAPALQAFFAEQSKGLAVVSTRVENGIAGAELATDAYNKADADMSQKIESYQRKAAGLTLADELARRQAQVGGGAHRKGGR